MIQQINKNGLEYFQLDLGGICYIGFDLFSILSTLSEKEKNKQLTFLN